MTSSCFLFAINTVALGARSNLSGAFSRWPAAGMCLEYAWLRTRIACSKSSSVRAILIHTGNSLQFGGKYPGDAIESYDSPAVRLVVICWVRGDEVRVEGILEIAIIVAPEEGFLPDQIRASTIALPRVANVAERQHCHAPAFDGGA